jgi:hypothetical protein
MPQKVLRKGRIVLAAKEDLLGPNLLLLGALADLAQQQLGPGR